MVNEFSPKPTFEFNEDTCTRFCHNKGCKHYHNKNKDNLSSSILFELYKKNISWLKKKPFGLSYQEMNLLIYVILGPILIIFLLWGIIRKRNG